MQFSLVSRKTHRISFTFSPVLWLSPGPHTCQASTLPPAYTPQPQMLRILDHHVNTFCAGSISPKLIIITAQKMKQWSVRWVYLIVIACDWSLVVSFHWDAWALENAEAAFIQIHLSVNLKFSPECLDCPLIFSLHITVLQPWTCVLPGSVLCGNLPAL